MLSLATRTSTRRLRMSAASACSLAHGRVEANAASSAATFQQQQTLAAADTAAAEVKQSRRQPPRTATSASPSARILDGRSTADDWLEEIADKRRSCAELCLWEKRGFVPSLAVVHIKHRDDSALYVERKREACARVGIRDVGIDLDRDTSQEDVLAAVRSLAKDKSIHGILVQLPLPEHLDETDILNAVPACKDVDAFNPTNAGRLALAGREPAFLPCCPKGVLELLDRNHISVVGKHVCVVGSSNTVGMPLSSMLHQRGAAAVTVCDTHHALREENQAKMRENARMADVLVAAVGRAGLVGADWVRPGSVVVDVGINKEYLGLDEVHEGTRFDDQGRPYRVTGDVAFDDVCSVASAITPVPGGVGPMTIAALMDNALIAARRAAERDRLQRGERLD